VLGFPVALNLVFMGSCPLSDRKVVSVFVRFHCALQSNSCLYRKLLKFTFIKKTFVELGFYSDSLSLLNFHEGRNLMLHQLKFQDSNYALLKS
jgi:hypothetical protein